MSYYIIMAVVGCRHPQKSYSEYFPNCWRNYEVEYIFSKVEDLTSEIFLKMNSITDIYLAKPVKEAFLL